jgi:hypothetical protein
MPRADLASPLRPPGGTVWPAIVGRAPASAGEQVAQSADLPTACVNECLDFVGFLGLPVEYLLPHDRLVELLQPPTTWNPWLWYVTRWDSETTLSASELELKRRRAAKPPRARLVTLRDVVGACRGTEQPESP